MKSYILDEAVFDRVSTNGYACRHDVSFLNGKGGPHALSRIESCVKKAHFWVYFGDLDASAMSERSINITGEQEASPRRDPKPETRTGWTGAAAFQKGCAGTPVHPPSLRLSYL